MPHRIGQLFRISSYRREFLFNLPLDMVQKSMPHRGGQSSCIAPLPRTSFESCPLENDVHGSSARFEEGVALMRPPPSSGQAYMEALSKGTNGKMQDFRLGCSVFLAYF
jgi:hypothetical protein